MSPPSQTIHLKLSPWGDNVKNMSGSTTTWRILVSGRVQGVGYRRFTEKRALELGLQGWVRNLINEKVEVQVQGPAETIDRFLEILKQGPAFSQVVDVSVEKKSGEIFQGFQVRADGGLHDL